jgi:DNA-binding response OmpR family regulator
VSGKQTVLIVEDNLDLAEAARHFLEIKRYRVLISDGRDIKQVLENDRPDIIILDIFLGPLDGREICRDLKKDEKTRSIPVIMLSAHDKLSKAYDDNYADGYVMKPFALNELLNEIELLIKKPGTSDNE